MKYYLVGIKGTGMTSLATYLKEAGYYVVGSDTEEEYFTSDILKNNNWNYTYSYDASRIAINEAINKHTSLKYFIDIHRDSITKNYSTININNKSYAKVLFVIGTDHTNWQQNYQLANSLNILIDKYYSGLSRGIIKKSGPNVNGIYNQDINPFTILIEVGGVDNTIEEVNNTMLALSDILNKHIKGE